MKTPSPSRRLRLSLVVAGGLSVALFFVLQQADRHDSSTDSPARSSSPSGPSSQAGVPDGSLSGKASDRGPSEADRQLGAEGARTDVSLSSFPAKEYQRQQSPAGKPAGAPVGDAFVHVPSSGRRVAMEPNQLGEFPAVETRLADTVGVRLSLDTVKPGTPVRVVILDGGSFPTVEGVSQVLPAADWRGVAFEYTTSANIGTHRVLVQAAGQPSRILDFNALEAKGS